MLDNRFAEKMVTQKLRMSYAHWTHYYPHAAAEDVKFVHLIMTWDIQYTLFNNQAKQI